MKRKKWNLSLVNGQSWRTADMPILTLSGICSGRSSSSTASGSELVKSSLWGLDLSQAWPSLILSVEFWALGMLKTYQDSLSLGMPVTFSLDFLPSLSLTYLSLLIFLGYNWLCCFPSTVSLTPLHSTQPLLSTHFVEISFMTKCDL